MQFTSDITCIPLACYQKYAYDVRLNLHTFEHAVSETPKAIFKKIQQCVKSLSNFMGMWETDNRLIVSTNKIDKISENIWYFKTNF